MQAPRMARGWWCERRTLSGDVLSPHATLCLLQCRRKRRGTRRAAPWLLARTLLGLWVTRGDHRRQSWEEEHVDAYQALRQHLLHRLAHLEGRLDTVEHDRRRGTNTLDPDWEEQATVRQHDEALDVLAEE